MTELTDISLDDLPTWMRQAQQGMDWGVLLAIVFSLLAGWSFILRDGLPRTNATENYVFMAADYANAFREGRLYPRWSEAANHGYGAPIPNFFPPGAPYTAATIELLFTNNTVVAVRLVYILSFVLAGAMTYVLVMRWAGAAAGLLASVLYVYSPYVGLAAPFILGDLPGMIALGLIPALLWAVHRLLLLNRALDFALAAGITAALILTDPRAAVAGSILSAALLIWYSLTHTAKRRILLVILALLAGGAAASFYWLPALLESDHVTWNEPVYEPLPLKLTPMGLITPAQKVDLNEMLPTPPLTVGLALVLFVIISLGIHIRNRRIHGLSGVFLLGATAYGGVGLWLLPGEIWLLGPLVLCLAVVGGTAVNLREFAPTQHQRLTLPVMLVIALALAIPVWLSPLYPAEFGNTGLTEQIAYEQQGFGVAVLPPGAPIPTTLSPSIEPNLALINSYRSGKPIRLPQSQLGPGRQANLLRAQSHADWYLVNISTPTQFDFLRAYFPGWEARIGSEPIPLIHDETSGLIQLIVPPSANGSLKISLESTPVRRRAWITSWAAFGLVVIDLVRRLRRQQLHPWDEHNLLTKEDSRLTLIVLLGFLAAIWFFARPESSYSLHARPGYRLDQSIGMRSRTGVGLELISYDIENTTYSIGENLDFTLYWRTIRPLLRNYTVQVSLADLQREINWLPSTPHYPGGYLTRRWTTNLYMQDDHRIPLTLAINPGEYQIAVEVYDCNPTCDPGSRLNFYDAQGEFVGPLLVLPTVIHITGGAVQ